MRGITRSLPFALTLLLAAPAMAQPVAYPIDPAPTAAD